MVVASVVAQECEALHQNTLAAVDGLLQGAEQRAEFELRGRRPRAILTRSSPACRRPFAIALMHSTDKTRQENYKW